MSETNIIPSKNDIIINPKTNRPIKVGGSTWLKLVKKGILNGHYKDPDELAVEQENIDQQIIELDKTLPRGQQSVRGRGKYAGKIVRRSKRIGVKDMTNDIASIASKIVSDNIDELADLSGDDIEEQLQKLLLEELSIPERLIRSPTKRPSKNNQPKYVLGLSPLQEDSDD